jgi:hypothetical protein
VVIEMAEGVLPGFLKTAMDRYTKLDRRLQWRAEDKRATNLTEKFTLCNSAQLFHSRILVDGRLRLLKKWKGWYRRWSWCIMNYYHNILLYALRTIKVHKVGLWPRMKRRISIYDEASVIILTLACSIQLISSLLYCNYITELNLFIIFHIMKTLQWCHYQHF